MAKVFLSYSRVDALPFAREVYRRLTRDGIECFFDEASIEWGENFVLALEDGLDQCEHIIVILSPGFIESDWTSLERTSTSLDDPINLKRKLLPLLYRRCELPRFLKAIQYLDVSTQELFEKQYPDISQKLGGAVQLDTEAVDFESVVLPPIQSLPYRYSMPYRSLGNRFTGRVKPLLDLHKVLLQSDEVSVTDGVCAVVGTGGLGKTQLAIEYVHRFGAYYHGGVFWVNANQTYISAIVALAVAAGVELDEKTTAAIQVEMLWQGIASTNNTVLIIYDNFPENEQFQRWLPVDSTKVKTIVTTRRKDLAVQKIALEFMDKRESLAMLNTRERQFSSEQASPLTAMLGGLPLALELSTNYLNLRRDVPIESLAEEMYRLGEVVALDTFSKKYRDELPSGHEKTITATFQISWNLTCDYEKNMLELMACWAPTPVPRELIHKALDEQVVSILEDPVEEAIEALVRLSLFELDDENDPYMHRLLREFILSITPSSKTPLLALSATTEELSRSADDDDISAWEELDKVIPHAQSMIRESKENTEELIVLLRYFIWHQLKKGHYHSGKSAAEHALAVAENSYAANQIAVALAKSDLAAVLYHLNDNKAAMEYLRQAIPVILKESDGDLAALMVMGNVAIVLKELGQLTEAKAILEKVLLAKQNIFQSEHVEVGRAQANLAIVLKQLGDWETANQLHKQALETMKSHYPPGHVQIAMAQANLAEIRSGLGDNEAARDLLQLALKSMRKHYAAGHIEIAKVLENLANVQQLLGNLENARDLLEECLETMHENGTQGDLSIVNIQANLAFTYMHLGDLTNARIVYKQALKGKRQHYPPGDSELASTLINYGTTLLQLGEFAEAQQYLQEGLAIELKRYPPGHPEIATTQMRLGIALSHMGQKDNARELLQQALRSIQQHYPPEHPAIKAAQQNLSSLQGL